MEVFSGAADRMRKKIAAIQPKRPVGRPRSQAARAAILNAAYSFLQGQAVATISLLHIARKAHVSSATVYRWWPTKEALLLDAFLSKADHALVLQSDGPPLVRLKQYILQVGRFFTGDNGIVVARLLTAIQDNPILRKEFLARVFSPRNQEIRSLVQEAITLRQLPTTLEVSAFLDLIIGPLLARLLMRHEQIDEAFVLSAFDLVVAGTLAQDAAARAKRV
jgi:AcrR family transcriptional regulator